MKDTVEDREQIKTLKARYFYYLDHKNWDGWRNDIFVSDCVWRLSELEPDQVIRGIEEVIKLASTALVGTVTVHHGHMPIIDFVSADVAKGIWAMEDLIDFPKENLHQGKYSHLHGFGHYREEYVRTPKGWRIRSMELTRLRLTLS
jgi:hypothetical protein